MTAAFARKFHGPLSSDKGAFMATIHRFSLSLPVIVAMLTAAGCATTDVNHYKPALASQEQCCNRLAAGLPGRNPAYAGRDVEHQSGNIPVRRETLLVRSGHRPGDAGFGAAAARLPERPRIDAASAQRDARRREVTARVSP
jgi:hypothetical protein